MNDELARQLALDPSQSFIVQAPAGSGKTELLTQRVLKLLATVNDPEEILAVTFTRKAAAEMRHRIIAALRRAQRETCPEKAHEKLTWNLAQSVLKQDALKQWHLLQNPNRLRIVTIDALCAALVNRMPILSHSGGMAEVVEDASTYYQQAIERVLKGSAKEDTWAQALSHLLKHEDNRIEQITALLQTMLGKRDQWLPYLYKIRQQKNYLGTYFNEVLNKIICEHLTQLKQQFQPLKAELLPLLQYAASQLGPGSQLDPWADIATLPAVTAEDLDQWQAIIELLITKEGTWRKSLTEKLGFPSPSSTKDKAEKAQRKIQKENMLAFLEKCQENELLLKLLAHTRILPPATLSPQQRDILLALAELLPVVVASLQMVFQETGKMDFVEISLRALDALGEDLSPSDLALKLDYQLQHILIDEYQDTSLTQYRLFSQLVSSWQLGDGKTLFLVGDPMQSIYRFRGAEVSLFLYTQEQGLGQIKLTSLNLIKNFRSKANIVDWVNEKFVHIFPAENEQQLGGVSYCQAVAHHEEDPSSQVCVHTLPQGACDPANYILQLVRAALCEPNHSIAILARTRRHLAPIIPILKKANIPFVAHEMEHLAERSHVIDLMALLKAITDWTDRVAWLAVLRAPWLGLPLGDLLAITKAAGPADPIWKALLQYERLADLSEFAKQRLKTFVSLMQYWLANSQRQALSQYVRGLWIALGGPACYSGPIIEDIDTVLDLIEEYAVAGMLFDATALEKRLTELYADISFGVEQGNVVELMTIHKAKGLEFDTVIMPAIHAPPRASEQELLLWLERVTGGGQDLLLAPRRSQKEDVDPLYRYVDHQIRQKNAFEAARLFYVGVTRAKKNLHLVGECELNDNNELKKASSGSFLNLLWPVVTLEPIKAHHLLKSSRIPTNLTLKRLPADWRLPQEISRSLEEYKKEKLTSDNLPMPADYFAMCVGTLFHRFLQNWVNQLSEEQLLLPPHAKHTCTLALKRMGLGGAELEIATQKVMQGLSNMLEDPRGRWILSPHHQDRRTEWPLSIQTEKEVQNLVIDFAFLDEHGTRWIIDYKMVQMNSLNEKQLFEQAALYQPQLQRYQRALQYIERRPIRCGLYFPLAKAWWEMPCEEGIENG